MNKTRTAVVALGLAALVGLAGCTSPSTTPATTTTTAPATSAPASSTTTTAPVAPSTTSTTAAPTTTSTTAAPTTTSKAPAPTAPAGYTMVTATKSKIQMAFPDGLTTIDASQLTNNQAMKDSLSQIAQETGQTVEQLQAAMASLDLLSMDAKGNNINVLPSVVSGMPTLADLNPSLTQVGATDITTQDLKSALGPVLAVTYKLTLGGTPQNQTQLYAQTGPLMVGVITVTGVTWTPDEVSKIATTIVNTLASA